YKTDYTNKQETAIIIINNVTSTPIQNAAEAEIKGVEAELNVVATENLTLFGSMTYLDAHYGPYPAAITPSGVVDATGLRFTTSPKVSGYVGMRYRRDVGPGVVGFNADYAYRGKLPTTAQNNDPAIPAGLQASWRKGRGILNLNLSYELPDQQMT